jgi:hypothetical protein
VRVNVRRATYEHHARIARNHIRPALGRLNLTPAHVQTPYATKFDAGYALAARPNIHVTLNKALMPLYVSALATGMRQGEILGLPKTHLDLGRRVVRVR